MKILSSTNLKNLKDINIFVIGDIMLDHYVLGNINRISPEAPVMILDVNKEEYTLGGSGNVIKNLREIGVNVDCFSVIGQDEDGSKIMQMLYDLNVKYNIIQLSNIRTTRKTRYVTTETKSQLLRVDRETNSPIDIKFDINLDLYDIIIVSDYAKGVISKSIMDKLKQSGKKIIIDPKPKNTHLYDGAFILTPNKKEFNEMIPYPNHIEFTLKTLGKDGIDILQESKKPIHIHGKEIQVFNVSGCGDTVVAVVSTCIAMGLNIVTSTKIANECAGYVATKSGTDPIENHIFYKILNSYLE